MNDCKNIEIKRERGTIVVTIEGIHQKGIPRKISIRRQCLHPSACEELALHAVQPILREKVHGLIGFQNPTCTLVALLDNYGTVKLDIRDYEPNEEGCDYPPDTTYLGHPPIPISKLELIEEIIRWVETNLSEDNIYNGKYLGDKDAGYYQQLLEDARELFEYYQNEGSLNGFQWSHSREDMKKSLFNQDNLLSESRLPQTQNYILKMI